MWRAWNERAGQARTAAVFELVQQRMPSRPIEAPGAIAWLREQLAAYRATFVRPTPSTFERLADETDSLPTELPRPRKPCGTVVLSAAERTARCPQPRLPSNVGPSRRAVLSVLAA